MRVTILLAEPIVPPNRPVPIYGEAWPAGVKREVPAGGVEVAGVAGVVMSEAVLLRGVGMTTAGGFGAAAGLVGARRALLTQGVGARYGDVVKLLQQAVDGCIFGWPVPSNNGLRKEQTHCG